MAVVAEPWWCGRTETVRLKLVALTGKGKGAPALPLCKNIHNLLFPFCVSTVPTETLFEAEHRGLEGCCARARQHRNSVA